MESGSGWGCCQVSLFVDYLPSCSLMMAEEQHSQSMFIIRHGERLDSVDYGWVDRSPRPYDPPLTDVGVEQAKQEAESFRDKTIKVVVASPFLRCLQTGQVICDTLGLPGLDTCNTVADVFNASAYIYQQPVVPAKDIASHGIKVLNMDKTPVPRYPENTDSGLKRLEKGFQALADQHYPHNIVVVSHGYGVTQAVAMARGDTVYRTSGAWADFCGCVELGRNGKESCDWTIRSHNQDVHIARRKPRE